MIRWALWLLGGLLLGGIVHLSSILLLPRTATQDAYTRIAAAVPANRMVPLPAPTPDDAVLPFMDPAFASAVCRYDLAAGPLKLRVPVSQAYTSVSFYSRNGVAYYAINDRAAGRRIIELDLMTARQRADLPDDEEVTAADRLIVEAPTATGLILVRTFGPEPRARRRTVRGCLVGVDRAAQRAEVRISWHDENRPGVSAGPRVYFVTSAPAGTANSAPAHCASGASAAATIAWKRLSARSASTASNDGTEITNRSSA
jgi:uncharacterized membrane protein